MTPAALLSCYVLLGVAGGWPGTIVALAWVLWWELESARTTPSEQVTPDSPEGWFIRAAFLHLGYLCKVDGQVTPSEIRAAEAAMQRLGLNAEQRQRAVDWFREGKQGGYAIEAALAEWLASAGDGASLTVLFLELQITAAYADGRPSPQERTVLRALAERLDINSLEFARIEAQVLAALKATTGSITDTLASAYQTLGLTPSATDEQVTQAYRRLLSRHHPDKLAAQAVPKEVLALANEHTRQLRVAYQNIRKARAGARA